MPKSEAWISAKYLNTNSIHEKITTAINQSDGKVKINVPESYQLILKNNLTLLLRHNDSGLKVAFVACTKAHDVHKKSILSVSTADSALVVSSCEQDKLLVWDSRTSKRLN